jgi:hypothetical protein
MACWRVQFTGSTDRNGRLCDAMGLWVTEADYEARGGVDWHIALGRAFTRSIERWADRWEPYAMEFREYEYPETADPLPFFIPEVNEEIGGMVLDAHARSVLAPLMGDDVEYLTLYCKTHDLVLVNVIRGLHEEDAKQMCADETWMPPDGKPRPHIFRPFEEYWNTVVSDALKQVIEEDGLTGIHFRPWPVPRRKSPGIWQPKRA